MEVTELVELVERQRRLEELESNPAALSCLDYVEDMDKEMVNRMIGYLVEDNQRRKTDNESLRAQNKGLSEQMFQLREILRNKVRSSVVSWRRCCRNFVTCVERSRSTFGGLRSWSLSCPCRGMSDTETVVSGCGKAGTRRTARGLSAPAGARGRGDGGGGELAAKTSGRAAVGRESEEERVYG